MQRERERTTEGNEYRALVNSVQHPTCAHPYQTIFNTRSLEALRETGASLDVLTPIPFAPPIGPYSEYSHVPRIELWGSYRLHHPRFLYALPKRYFYGLTGESFAKRVTRYADERFEEPDVLHACSIYLDGYGLLPYARRHDVPLFVVAHGDVLLNYDDFSASVKEKITETLDECTRVLCVSEDFVTRASKLTDPSKVSLLPIGADPSNFPVAKRATLREKFGIDPDATVVLFCGQFIERKGIREIIDVVPRLDSPDTEIVCIGQSGDLREELERVLDQSSCPHRVSTEIPTSELREWFAVADLLLLPSHGEGRPTVIYEAMASRTAVLGSETGGIPEQIEDGETGLLVPPGDQDALERTLSELVADRDTLRRMGRNGYERLVEKGWTWKQHGERLAEVHQSVLDR